ncbi:MAG: right-handed parallel beta-helix repeat-containing protein, partial [Burkholderiales bacterium]|nr:right-handed parallel beta-helix repeat-containing protein [Opitutaceae bacterium]
RTNLINQPVAGAFYLIGIELDRTEPVAGGTFDPLAPSIRISIEVADPDAPTPLPRVAGDVLRIDNLSYTAPSFFVSPTGDDSAAGSEAAPFATLQHAVDRAQPGDVVFLLDGTHVAPPEQMLARIAKAGAPDRWIVLRSQPGQNPVLTGEGWNVIGLDHDSAYIELRDLVVRGQRKKFTIEQALADTKSGQPADPKFNTNGLALDARKGREDGGKAHHIRFIRCTVSDVPGGGLSAIAGDHITLEGNVVQDNAHLMRFAGSGISVFRAWDFDTDTGYKNFVLSNRAHGNRCYIPWGVVGRISDGNGIIIDDFINYQPGASKIPYRGRTLVANNLTFGNGGSGIHAYAANHVDIVNNTAYHNAQSPELVWRQIYAGGKCRDIRVVNNILYAQRGRPLNFTVSKDSKEILYAHNLIHGDGDNDVQSGGGLGTGTAVANAGAQLGGVRADPLFVRASLDPATADFHLTPGSPALDAATSAYDFIPTRDLDGHPRPAGPALDIGAYELPAR